jgi:Lon protease-like protein
MGERFEIPLFPLGVVLFEGGRLPLQIFETRYLDMVSRCLRDEIPFGVVLIRSGRDARLNPNDRQPEIFEVGSEATIVNFNQLSNGFLSIVVRGGRKFRILESWEQPDHLLLAEIEYLPREPEVAIGKEHQALVDILKELMKHSLIEKLELDIDFSDASAVGRRLVELLPVEMDIKQSLLQLQRPRERLSEITRLVNKLRG